MAKIEVVRQQDLRDCGACCLSSIIKYYDGYVPFEKIREDTLTTVEGSTAYHLIMAATSYGFDAMGVKAKSIEDKNIYLPAIAHVIQKNGLSHFVVLYKITKDMVWLMDPAKGKVKIRKQEFLEIWDHILILLSPNGKILSFDKKQTLFSIIINLILKDKSNFITVCTLNLFIMLFSVISSFYFQIAVSEIEKENDINFFIFLIILFSIFTILKVLLSYLKSIYLNYFNKNIDVRLFAEFLNHIFHLPLSFMENRSTGEIISRVNELSEIKNFLAAFFTNVLLNSILILGSAIALYFISSKLLMVLLILLILYVAIGFISSRLIYRKVKQNIEKETEFNSILVENIEMNTSIQNLNLVSTFFIRVEESLVKMLRENFKTISFLNKIAFLKEFIYEIGIFGVTTLGIYFVSKGSISILSLVTFNSLILYLLNPVKEMIDLLPRYNYLKASFQKLNDFLSVVTDNDESGYQRIENPSIEFINVSYTFNKFYYILKDVNFKIKSGEKVFLAGPSGTGKTTICRIIVGYLRNCPGTILIGGLNILDYDISAFDYDILYVCQNEKLFSGTIRENIVAKREVAEKDFLKVCELCKIEDIVKSRPNRYDTMINASQNNLSGGEIQRIILARAMLKKAKIIILDEALSEVNLETEREIIENLKREYPNSTMIYVSHKKVNDLFDHVIHLKGGQHELVSK